MKTIKQIIKQDPIFLGFENEFDVIMRFEGISMTEKEYNMSTAPYSNASYYEAEKVRAKNALEQYKDCHILFAHYDDGGYSGIAFVLFEKKNKLYEVYGSHCSCYGLEGQWMPEITNTVELKARLARGSDDHFYYCQSELEKFLGVNEKNS
jgi:hypothetical protein